MKTRMFILIGVFAVALTLFIVACRDREQPLPPAPTLVTGSSPAGSVVTNVTVSAAYIGFCPYTIKFAALVTLNKPGAVTYRWERSDGGSDGPYSITFDAAGSYTIGSGDWKLTLDGTYWARLHILSPNDVTSNQAPFMLTCVARPPVPPSPAK